MLINCVAYQEGRRLEDVPPEQIGAYLQRPGILIWVALVDPAPEELSLMQQQFQLHELAIEDARHGQQRPKIDEYDDEVFAVMQTVEPSVDGLHVGEMDVFVGPNFVLSVRSHTEKGFADVRARCEREPHLLRHGPGFVLYALMDAVVDRYFPILEDLEIELERIEQHMFSESIGRSNVEALYDLKQRAMVLKHAVAPLLEASGKLHGGRVPQCCIDTQEYFRDVYDHLFRINQSIESLRDMVTTAMSVNLSLITISENEVTKRLAAYAALVAIPTMVAGIYGMNFKHMPELDWNLGYPLALVGMAAIDGWLFWRFRKAKWL